MANPIEYIVFEPDQVLTNDHLNETFNYLDQQNRWTRNKLIGIGIVCGLDIVLNPGVIEITKGCGITSQGYLISQDTTDYTYYVPYTPVDMPADLPFTYTGNLPFFKPYCANKNLWTLITDDQYDNLEAAQQANAVTISSATNFLLDYVVVLFLEASETDLKNCNMLDCNNSGSTMAFTLRPLLVAVNDLPGAVIPVSEVLTINPSLLLSLNLNSSHQVTLKRFNVPYIPLNTSNDVINAFVNLVDDPTLSQISFAYNYCYDSYSGLVDVTTNPFTNLLTNLQAYRNAVLTQNPVFIQYFYDFVDDLIKAYNEFSAKVSIISGTCCPDENLFPLHLVLGSASQGTDAFNKDNYRDYFMYSNLFSQMGNDATEAMLLFNRMVIMVNSFTLQSQALALQAALKITPSQYELPLLSDRAIPYYYQLNTSGAELYKYWNYYKTSHGNAVSNLSYNSTLYNTNTTVTQPLLYDIERYNFLRVEGHIGQNYQTVLSALVSQQLNYNLPFDVVAVSADQLQTGAALPQCNLNDLDTDYQLIIAEAACKIHTIFCFVSKMPYQAPTIGLTNEVNRDISFNVDATAAPTIKFSEFRLDTAALNLTLLDPATTYQKGDFMRKYCPPVANTIGSAYLNILSNGAFANPIQINQNNTLTAVYFYLFAFIDAVEQMMYLLQTNTLAQLDMTAFNTANQTYLTDVALVLDILTGLTIQDAAAASTDTNAADAAFVTLAEDIELGLLAEELGVLTNICIYERLQVLAAEYSTRLTQYQKQLNFLTYYKNHPGLEHKAGVPKGGTFVLVYHSGAAISSLANNTAATLNLANAVRATAANQVLATAVKSAQTTAIAAQSAQPVATAAQSAPTAAAQSSATAVPQADIMADVAKQAVVQSPVVNTDQAMLNINQPVVQSPTMVLNTDQTMLNINQTVVNTDVTNTSLNNLDDTSLNLITSFVNACTDAPADTKQTVLGILNRLPVFTRRPTATYSIADGAIIADFYIPYMCCSDCPPVAYMFPEPVTPVQPKPTVTMGTTFCQTDSNAEPITVSAPGGTFNTITGLDGTKLTFTPATAGPGIFQIVYTLNGVSSDPVSVTVLTTPVATFTITSTPTTGANGGQAEAITFVPDAVPDDINNYSYAWTFGAGFPIATSTIQNPEITLNAAPLTYVPPPINTTIILSVANGACNTVTTTTNVVIRGSSVSIVEPVAPSSSLLKGMTNLFTKKPGS